MSYGGGFGSTSGGPSSFNSPGGKGGFGGGGFGGFGGGGGFAPGGFSSPAAGGGFQDMAQPRVRKSRVLIPCTIAQLHTADYIDDRFVVDDIEISQVEILGCVKSFSGNDEKVDFVVNDGTGDSINCRMFTDKEDPSYEEVQSIRENTYVRIIGHLKNFNNQRSLTIFRIMPVTDPNEISEHPIHVAHDHMYLKVYDKMKMADMNGQSSATNGVTSPSKTGFQGGQPRFQPNQGGSMPGANLITKVAEFLQSNCTPGDMQGLHENDILSNFRDVPQQKIKEALQNLLCDGQIYNTIDDHYYRWCTA